MKVTCRFSGVEFRAEHFNFSLIDEHPLYHLPVDRLLGLFRIWVGQQADEQIAIRLSEIEIKMLFIAFLKATDLVQFDTAANPSLAVAVKNLPSLMTFVVFRQSIPDVEIAFPRISINRYTNDCSNCHDWLEVWNTRKTAWMDDYRQEHISLKLQHMEELLTKLIKSPMGDQARKINMLAKWALVASDAPNNIHDYWTQLFKLKGLELYQARTVDLEEMLDYMESKIPVGSLFGYETLRHVRELYARNAKGIMFALGNDETLDPFELEKNPFRFVEDDLETINTKIAASTAPASEPKPGDYPNRFLYLKAKASYTLAKKEQEVKQLMEARQQAFLAKAALENIPEDTSEEDENITREIIQSNGGISNEPQE